MKSFVILVIVGPIVTGFAALLWLGREWSETSQIGLSGIVPLIGAFYIWIVALIDGLFTFLLLMVTQGRSTVIRLPAAAIPTLLILGGVVATGIISDIQQKQEYTRWQQDIATVNELKTQWQNELKAQWQQEGCKFVPGRIVRLTPDRDKRVWIMYGDSLSLYHQGELIPVDLEIPRIETRPMGIAVDTQERVWVLAGYRGVIVKSVQPPFGSVALPNSEQFPVPEGFLPYQIAADKDGKVAIAFESRNQLALFENGKWALTPPLPPHRTDFRPLVEALVFDASGGLWVYYLDSVSGTRRLVQLQHGGWIEYGSVPFSVEFLYFNLRGQLLIGGQYGLYSLAEGGFTDEAEVLGIPTETKWRWVHGVSERPGQMLLATDAGLIVVSNGRIINYPLTKSSMGGDGVRGVAFDSKGDMVLGTGEGLVICPPGAGPNK